MVSIPGSTHPCSITLERLTDEVVAASLLEGRPVWDGAVGSHSNLRVTRVRPTQADLLRPSLAFRCSMTALLPASLCREGSRGGVGRIDQTAPRSPFAHHHDGVVGVGCTFEAEDLLHSHVPGGDSARTLVEPEICMACLVAVGSDPHLSPYSAYNVFTFGNHPIFTERLLTTLQELGI